MRAVARYSAIFLPSSSISNSATRAHFMPRTVFAASATAFSAAFAKLSFDVPTTSITFCAIWVSFDFSVALYRCPATAVAKGGSVTRMTAHHLGILLARFDSLFGQLAEAYG